LLETRVLTCASPAYVARHGAPTHPEQLAQSGHQCLLIRDPRTGRPFDWEFQRGKEVVPLTASGRLMVNDTGSLLGACLGGTGVAQLLEIYARGSDCTEQAGSRYFRTGPRKPSRSMLLHHSSHLVSAKVRVFLDFVQGLAS
jgi:DNA-binding transcriptional LysR family regulator